ncbi:MAG: hypothetical protein SF162_12635 [bacterium]|nr:hypothetical protein [bacterium]
MFNRRTLIICMLMVLLSAVTVLPAFAGEKFSIELNAEIVDCNVVITFNMPSPRVITDGVESARSTKPEQGDILARRGSSVIVYVIIYDNGVQLAMYEVTGAAGSPQQVIYPITQRYIDEDITINLNPNDDADPTDAFETGLVIITDAVADACIDANIAVLDCPYPPQPLLGQGRVLGPVTTYWAARLDTNTAPPVVLPVGTSWWILEARDGFYKLFIACKGRYVWVTAESLGANFDVVWAGRPLPDAGSQPTATPTPAS